MLAPCRNRDGKLSAARVQMLAMFGVLLLAWLGIGLAIVLTGLGWADFSGWLGFGHQVFIVSMGGYVGNEFGGAIERNRKAAGS